MLKPSNADLDWGRVARRLQDTADDMRRAACGDSSEENNRALRIQAAVLASLADAIWAGLT